MLLSSITRLLLEHGADRLAKDRNGKTPFQLVEEQHDVIFAAHERDETIRGHKDVVHAYRTVVSSQFKHVNVVTRSLSLVNSSIHTIVLRIEM